MLALSNVMHRYTITELTTSSLT